MNLSFRLFTATALGLLLSTSSQLVANDAALDSLLPLPKDVRKILDQRCVMCHGEVINGKAEIREDLDLSTDEAIRETLSEPGRLKEMIVKDKMPKTAKLSFRLRRDPNLKERLESLKADYESSGEKKILLAWLKDVVATETPEKDEKKD